MNLNDFSFSLTIFVIFDSCHSTIQSIFGSYLIIEETDKYSMMIIQSIKPASGSLN